MEFSKITKNFEKYLIFEKDFEKDKIFKLKIWFDSWETIWFKNFLKSQSKFSNLMREKGKDNFFIFEFLMKKEKNNQKAQNMKIMNQNN